MNLPNVEDGRARSGGELRRVALVCPYSWSVPGGVQHHVAELAAYLREQGVGADVIAPADQSPEDPGVRVVGPSVSIADNGSVVRLALYPSAVRATVRMLRAGAYDLVHLHEPMLPAPCFAALATATVPVVGTFHMVGESARWYRLFRPAVRIAARRLAARVAVSPAARDFVRPVLPGRYRIVPLGIDTSRYRGPGERGGRRILFVGRHEPRKGLRVLLEAFARLTTPATLELVGVEGRALGWALSRLPERVRQRVVALGRLPEAARIERLHRADILCAPSLGSESFGLVLCEGMAAGVPVVASRIPGYADVLPSSCGVLVPAGDAPALAGALDRLLADGARRAAMAGAGPREARRYDWSVVGPRLLSVYHEALAARVSR